MSHNPPPYEAPRDEYSSDDEPADHDPATAAALRNRLARRRAQPSQDARAAAAAGRVEEARTTFAQRGRRGSHHDLRAEAGASERRARFKGHGRVERDDDLRDLNRQHEEQRLQRLHFEQEQLARNPNWGSSEADDLAFAPPEEGRQGYVAPPPLYQTSGRTYREPPAYEPSSQQQPDQSGRTHSQGNEERRNERSLVHRAPQRRAMPSVFDPVARW